MNPWIILAAVVAFGVAVGGSGALGFRLGRDSEVAARAKTEEVVKASREAMQDTAAKAIASIEVKHVTVKQQLDTEIREKPVYRDCVASPDGVRYVNAALTGADTGPAGGGELPGASTTDGPVIRGRDAEAGRGRHLVP